MKKKGRRRVAPPRSYTRTAQDSYFVRAAALSIAPFSPPLM